MYQTLLISRVPGHDSLIRNLSDLKLHRSRSNFLQMVTLVENRVLKNNKNLIITFFYW